MADSWLTDGNCDVCRRKNYCGKGCTRGLERMRRKKYNALMSMTPIGSSIAKYMGSEGY